MSDKNYGEVKGSLFNIQRFCTHDGPGVRTTVFLKGCPLRCLWCHNPEGVERGREVVYDASKCIGCRACLEACEHGGHLFSDDGIHTYRADRCVKCGKCVEGCFSGAMEMFGERQAAADVVKVIALDKPFYATSGGGVTLSGGEPLYQPDFAEALLRLCRADGISTAVESSCATSWSLIERLRPFVDLWMCDVKHLDPVQHRALTGSDNVVAHENIRRLCEEGARMMLRLPLIPSLNDDEENLRALGGFVRKLEPSHGLEILPYHRIAIDKYRRLRKDYTLDTLREGNEEDVRRAAAILRESGAARVFNRRMPDL